MSNRQTEAQELQGLERKILKSFYSLLLFVCVALQIAKITPAFIQLQLYRLQFSNHFDKSHPRLSGKTHVK